VAAPLLEASNLTKVFGTVRALDGLNLKILPGEIYGLLGPNGAGKSTTMKIVSGLLEPTSGAVRVAGFDPVSSPVEVSRGSDMLQRIQLCMNPSLQGIFSSLSLLSVR